MAAVEFDSYRLVKDFQAAGFTEAQAVVFMQALCAWQGERLTRIELRLAVIERRLEMSDD